MFRFSYLLSCLLLLSFISCNNAQLTSSESREILINLTSDITASGHSALMGLHVAQKALRNGVDATVFVNVGAVKLFAPGGNALECHGENFHEILYDIMSQGGKIRCCPHCLSSAGLDESNLIEGSLLSREEELIHTLSSNIVCMSY